MPGKPRKHVPLRTCIACREKRSKRDLIRIVRTPEGTFEIDLRGKRSGRGAYVCRRQQCWDAALQPRRLSHALKCEVKAEQVAVLRVQALPYIEGLAAESQTTPFEDSGPEGQGLAGSV